jgi:hypothetical protein
MEPKSAADYTISFQFLGDFFGGLPFLDAKDNFICLQGHKDVVSDDRTYAQDYQSSYDDYN